MLVPIVFTFVAFISASLTLDEVCIHKELMKFVSIKNWCNTTKIETEHHWKQNQLNPNQLKIEKNTISDWIWSSV